MDFGKAFDKLRGFGLFDRLEILIFSVVCSVSSSGPQGSNLDDLLFLFS